MGVAMARATFGGAWTERKLDVVRRYLELYTKALKNQPFRRIYIDAFAGTGYRTRKPTIGLPLLDPADMDNVAKGSARLALEVDPPFDRYVLIELARQRVGELASLQTDYPARKIEIVRAGANDAIANLCSTTNWRQTRGVVFLDPYGLQVSWNTLVAIQQTRSLDMWVLVPTGIGLNRLLKKDGQIPIEWQDALDRFLGTRDWRTEFYRVEEEGADLFGDQQARSVKEASAAKFERFVLKRLHSIFPIVLDRVVPLTNSRGQVMYLLCFASANPSPKVRKLATEFARWATKV
jgi:three-Cys-motif partner protein